ncbi:MAG TPA: sensor domain-containing diguanylate cyclase [Mariprofundaceae bacterium]|nr:sensor domain-containing diguanylate cyclase [Mariprofundaceae bacterium]
MINASENYTPVIQAEQVRLLFSGMPASIVGGIILAALIAYGQQGLIGNGTVLAWLTLIIVISAARTGLLIWYHRSVSAQTKINSKIWLQRLRLGSLLSGAAWGLGGVLLFPADDITHQVFLAFVLAGVSSGAAVNYAVDMMSVASFLLPTLSPFMLRLFLQGEAQTTLMGIAVLLFIGFLFISTRKIYQRMSENIVLRIKARESELSFQASEARFRQMFEGNDSVMLLIEPDSGSIVNANAAASRFYGYTVEQMCRLNISEINILESEEVVTARHQAIHAENSSFTFPHRLANGEVRTVEVHTSPVEVAGRMHLFSIIQDITERKRLEDELMSQAHIDALTGLNNRRYFFELAEHELARAKRHNSPFAVLMLDLDYFKRVNDTYGHLVGDKVLQKLGTVFVQTLREIDIMGRIGGEEFVILLPETKGKQALQVAERLRLTIAGEAIAIKQGSAIHFTVSIGVTTFIATDARVEDILNRADTALYAAKNSGRNRICSEEAGQ